MSRHYRKCALCGVSFETSFATQHYCTPSHAVEGETVMRRARAKRFRRNLEALGRGPVVKRVLRGRGEGLALKESGAMHAARIRERKREIMDYDPTPVEGEQLVSVLDTEAEAAAMADFEARLAGHERVPDPWE